MTDGIDLAKQLEIQKYLTSLFASISTALIVGMIFYAIFKSK